MTMKKNPNIEVSFQGVIYKVRKSALREYTYGENEGKKYLSIGPTEGGQMVKQFVKNLNKEYLCKVKAEHFSMGNSLHVWVCQKDGSPIPQEDYNKIDNFADLFKYGSFDGMTDMYNYEGGTYGTDNGNYIGAGCKDVMVDNRPKSGTVEYIINEVKNQGREFGEAVKWVSDKKVIEKAKAQL